MRGLLRNLSTPAVACLLLTACLNTRSTALQPQPAALTSPAAACREAAEAAGWKVIDVTDVVQVSEGYWEARFVVDDAEMRNLLGCRHNTVAEFTEVVELED